MVDNCRAVEFSCGVGGVVDSVAVEAARIHNIALRVSGMGIFDLLKTLYAGGYVLVVDRDDADAVALADVLDLNTRTLERGRPCLRVPASELVSMGLLPLAAGARS